MGREAGERGAGGDATAAARHALAPVGSRPPAVLVVLAALLVAGTIVASVVGTLSLLRGPAVAGPPPPAAAAPPEIATPPSTPTTAAAEAAPTPAPTAAPPVPPADPRVVFQDPALRTLAEPFLAGPAVSCEQRPPAPDETESVACDLGGGRAAAFSRMIAPDAMRDRRQDIVLGRQARPGTVVSVRWRYVAGGTDIRAGIPAGKGDRGEGVRARYVDREGVPRLYFDQDATACTGALTLTRPSGNGRADLEELRTFWADPTA
ncbi:hypothetical protein FHX44_11250 [Pseudonocardia hierapolitana]|uniref:Uncharacterized protein n=1 Tax=Pseudonocardia hierapolitana TaxID=1128676 RepID=A0A561SHM3_9PSEU|nr:hypothetical protein [Pseudonocardia hierapolitana]TWF74370.1 hypothetical protein FHX44_11250 [Pseudonocardia hierapolitana]